MSARNVFVALILLLIIALVFYLFRATGSATSSSAPAEPPPVLEQPATPAITGSVKPMSESNAKLKELQLQQGALARDGLSHLYLVKCSACHGRDGRGPVGPPIAGKNKEENLALLMKYKNKQVPNSAMLGLLEQTSDQELDMLAGEIAAF